MAKFNELLEHPNQQRAQVMLDEIQAWREVREAWVKDQQARAEKLGSELAAYDKPPVYLYGMF